MAIYQGSVQTNKPLLEAIGKACKVLDILVAFKDPLSQVSVLSTYKGRLYSLLYEDSSGCWGVHLGCELLVRGELWLGTMSNSRLPTNGRGRKAAQAENTCHEDIIRLLEDVADLEHFVQKFREIQERHDLQTANILSDQETVNVLSEVPKFVSRLSQFISKYRMANRKGRDDLVYYMSLKRMLTLR